MSGFSRDMLKAQKPDASPQQYFRPTGKTWANPQEHPSCGRLQVTLQRPTVVAEIGFLLAVTKFFVPTMAISGVSPIPFISQDIYLTGMLHSGVKLLQPTTIWSSF